MDQIPKSLRAGDVIGGCEIEEFIAHGGMGDVYRARKKLLGKTVAVKVLQRRLMSDSGLLRRFIREAKMASRLDHPSIVKVHDIGKQGGLYYIVMEYIQGRDLKEIVETEGPLSWRKALRVVRQVAEALDYAHRRDVIHRDIKPANVLLTGSGEAKVADLGLARPIGDDNQLTMTGQIVGTPVFMSPEQCRGDPVDGRTDIYSLGATLYTVLSGKPPFRGETTPAILHKVANSPPRPLQSLVPDLPEKVVALVQRMMAKHPGARHQRGQEVVASVNEILLARIRLAGEEPDEPGSFLHRVPWGRLAFFVLVVTAIAVAAHVLPPYLESSASAPVPAGNASGAEPGRGDRGDDDYVDEEGSEEVADEGVDEDGEWLDGGSGAGRRDGGPDRVRVRRQRSKDRKLDGSIRSFREALLSGDSEAILMFFEPSIRDERSLHYRVAGVLEAIDSQGLEPGTYFSHKRARDRATSVLLFRRPAGGRPLGLPFDWVLVDERWYVRPRRGNASGEE